MLDIRYLVLIFLQLISTLAQGGKKCYSTNGTEFPSDWGTACRPKEDSSNCCGFSDYCSSNGLCLDAVGDNYFTVQGCTSQNWDGCTGGCDIRSELPMGYRRVFFCGQKNDAGLAKYCCGDSAACCDVQSTSTFRSMSVGVEFTRPTLAAATTSSSSTTKSTTISTTQTLVSTSSPAQQSDPPGGTLVSSAGSPNNTQNLAIGLGVGIPLGIAFIAALAFLGWQLQKRNKIGTVAATPAPTYYTQDDAMPQEYDAHLHKDQGFQAQNMQELQRDEPRELWDEPRFELQDADATYQR